MLRLHPSGYYAWKAKPDSKRAVDDRRLLGLLKQAWLESGGVYGYRKLTLDMRDLGEGCSRHRVAKLLRHEGLKARRGYGKRPRPRGGAAAIVAPNLLEQQLKVSEPNTAWVTDITYIATHEGWLYLAALIDLYSRPVAGGPRAAALTPSWLLMPCTWLSGGEGPAIRSLRIPIKAANSAAMNGSASSQATTCSPA